MVYIGSHTQLEHNLCDFGLDQLVGRTTRVLVRRDGTVDLADSIGLGEFSPSFGVAGEGVGQFGPEERVTPILPDDIVGISVQKLLRVQIGIGPGVGVTVMRKVIPESEFAIEGAAILLDLADDGQFAGRTDLLHQHNLLIKLLTSTYSLIHRPINFDAPPSYQRTTSVIY